MRHAERQTFAYKVIRQIRRVGKVLADSFAHTVNINRHGFNHIAVNRQAEFQGINGIKEAFLVLLQILVVG